VFPCYQEGQRTVHRDTYVEVDKAYYDVPPEYISRQVWVRWDRREVRIFNTRWEQIRLHAPLAPGQFTRTLGLGGGHGPLGTATPLLAQTRPRTGNALRPVGPRSASTKRARWACAPSWAWSV